MTRPREYVVVVCPTGKELVRGSFAQCQFVKIWLEDTYHQDELKRLGAEDPTREYLVLRASQWDETDGPDPHA